MHYTSLFAAAVVVSRLAVASPATDTTVKVDSGLRLIKTSEADPGTWVTEEDKISKYRAKKINFVDITDIKDSETLERLSTTSDGTARVAAITYPTTLTHQTEANALIAKTSSSGPQSWLQTLTK